MLRLSRPLAMTSLRSDYHRRCRGVRNRRGLRDRGSLRAGPPTSITPPATTGNKHSQLAAARLMRAHAVPTSRTPDRGRHDLRLSPGALDHHHRRDHVSAARRFEAAEKICKPQGGTSSRKSARARATESTPCWTLPRRMRQHGISQYKKPQFPPGGGISAAASAQEKPQPRAGIQARRSNLQHSDAQPDPRLSFPTAPNHPNQGEKDLRRRETRPDHQHRNRVPGLAQERGSQSLPAPR